MGISSSSPKPTPPLSSMPSPRPGSRSPKPEGPKPEGLGPSSPHLRTPDSHGPTSPLIDFQYPHRLMVPKRPILKRGSGSWGSESSTSPERLSGRSTLPPPIGLPRPASSTGINRTVSWDIPKRESWTSKSDSELNELQGRTPEFVSQKHEDTATKDVPRLIVPTDGESPTSSSSRSALEIATANMASVSKDTNTSARAQHEPMFTVHHFSPSVPLPSPAEFSEAHALSEGSIQHNSPDHAGAKMPMAPLGLWNSRGPLRYASENGRQPPRVRLSLDKGVRKSSLAEPATTRSDVRVVSLTPGLHDISVGSGATEVAQARPPKLSIVQLIESENSAYEILWEGTESGSSAGSGRESTSWCGCENGNHECFMLSNPLAQRPHGLEAINAKLSEWSWENQQEPVRREPQFGHGRPDEDVQHHHHDLPKFSTATKDGRLIYSNNDPILIAPANTQQHSAINTKEHSRQTSQHVSFGPTRENSPPASLVGTSSNDPSDQAREAEDALGELRRPSRGKNKVSDPSDHRGERFGTAIGASSGRRRMSRAPSNTASDAWSFLGHRDSLALAHERIMKVNNEHQPIITPRKDSVSIAKSKKMKKTHPRKKSSTRRSDAAKTFKLQGSMKNSSKTTASQDESLSST
ncbi:hypothetical protein BDY21DRAFT_19062 [Lineolata rhizophorae]|uniref:Uncharacterized protein n=1 Tax=Lineolata rhizophorae TaxID=578093 RepID=A0A6A6P2F5_9PEZI|nr:hypothetical protein BDY21DRAFT_19062 [Lineolata rhizophorae]